MPIFSFKKSRTIKTIFGKYIDDKTIDAILDGSIDISTPEIKHIGYLLVLVKEEGYDNYQTIMNRLINIVQQNNGMIETITGSFICILIGVPLPVENITEKRKSLVRLLSKELGVSIAVVHGDSHCLVGNIGNNTYASYTALIPDYKEKLHRLSSLEYDSSIEI